MPIKSSTYVLIFSLMFNLLAAATFSLCYRFVQDSSEPSAAQIQSIHALLDRQVADWNKGDLDGFLEGYWKSPKLVFQSGGDRFEGFDSVKERYRKRYLGKKETMGTLAFAELEIQPLGYSAAFARGKFHLDFVGKPPLEGRFTLFLRKYKDGWKIVHDHTSAAP